MAKSVKTQGKVSKIVKKVPKTWEEALQEFLYLKQAQGRSKTTIEDYKRFVNYFFKRYPKAFHDNKLKSAVLEYMSDDIKPATFNLRREYLKAFFEWCIEEEILTQNPFINLPKRKDSLKNVNIDNETLTNLLTLQDKRTWSGLRDYALMLLTLDTGIRPSEAFTLLISDVNLKSFEISIRADNAKTRTSRTLPILPCTADAIKQLIQARHNSWGNKVPVFCTYQGTKLERRTWNLRMKKYSEMLEIKINPYDLRHCFATGFLRNGGNAFSLQRTLGHTDLTMTKRYVSLVQEDLKDQHSFASPLNSIMPQKNRMKKIK